jgi:hypothetical protein
MRRTSAGRDGYDYGNSLDPVARDGFYVEPGCGGSTSGFPPDRLGPQGAVVYHLVPWSRTGWGRWSTTWCGGSITGSTSANAHAIRHFGLLLHRHHVADRRARLGHPLLGVDLDIGD